MAGHQPPVSGPERPKRLTAALWLVGISVVFGIGSGTVSVMTGLADHSLSVLAVGLGVLADVTGSATLVWRFRAERRQPGQSQAAEARAALVVAAALAIASAVITLQGCRVRGQRGLRGWAAGRHRDRGRSWRGACGPGRIRLRRPHPAAGGRERRGRPARK